MYTSSLPLQEYRELNEKSASPPKQLPIADPVAGLDIRCGPIVKLCGTLESGPNYRATIMLVVKESEEKNGPTPKVTYSIGASTNAGTSANSGEFPGTEYHVEEGFHFWRFDVNLSLIDVEQRVQYYINGEGKFQFFIPAIEESMNVVSYSCNGFSLGVDPKDFKSQLWYDVLKNHDVQHYHVMLGGGDQIYADSIKLHSKELEKWMTEKNLVKKRHMIATEDTVRDLSTYYLNHYMAWFGKGFWEGKDGKTTLQSLFPVAMSTIPSINIYDDHDIIDGFGSYHDSTMNQSIFKTVGNVAYKYYMLFQHHISPEEKAHNSIEAEPSWILSKGNGPFMQQKNHSNYIRLGKEISMVGIDCRTERKLKEIVKPSTYDVIFKRLEEEIKKAPDVKHLLVMLGVPILYPRLVWLEWLLTSSILRPIRALAERGVVNKGLVNEFDGGVEVLDDLNDHWCSKNHKKERNLLLKRLLEFGAIHGVRITILSGDVHLACIGRLKSKVHHHLHTHALKNIDPEELEQHNVDVLQNPHQDPRLIFNVISSAIVNTPPPDAMATLLNKRAGIHHYNKVTDEDILPIFLTNTDGSKRVNHQFLNQRNWSDLIIAKQSKYADKLSSEKTEWKLPGPQSEEAKEILEEKGKTLNERHVKYPLFEDSLVTTLHVEDKTDDFDCNSALYEVLIPKIVGKYKIENPGVKHLVEH